MSRVVRRGLHVLRAKATVVGLVAVVATLGPAGFSQASTGASAPHRGGSVTEVNSTINPTIDPAFNLVSAPADSPAAEAVYGPGLVYLNPNTSAVEMGFAQSLTTKTNGRVWTLVLHPGLKFSDGTAFNAAAVAYNIARFADPTTGSTLQAAAAQLTTKVLSKTTLQITCTPADAVFPVIMSQNFAQVASPTALAAEGAKYGSHPVGPGPFQVQSFVYGLSWSFVRNPYYRLYAPGQPYLDSVKILVEPNTQQSVTALQLGEAQTMVINNSIQYSGAAGVGMTLIAPHQPKIFDLVFNDSTPPFNNILAREAVYYATDRAAAGNVWNPGQPVSTNFFSPKSPFFNKKFNFPAQNTAKAQQLFNQLAAQGTPLKFTFLWSTSTQNGNLGAYVVGALSQFQNVTVTDDPEPNAQYNTERNAGTFQATGSSVPSQIPGAFTSFEANGSTNYGKWNDPTVTNALVQLQATTNLAKQKQLWNIVQQEFTDQFPFVWLQQSVEGNAYNKKEVGGVTTLEFGQALIYGPMYRK